MTGADWLTAGSVAAGVVLVAGTCSYLLRRQMKLDRRLLSLETTQARDETAAAPEVPAPRSQSENLDRKTAADRPLSRSEAQLLRLVNSQVQGTGYELRDSLR